MKLTPRWQGYRCTKDDWPAGKFLDIRKVGRFVVEALDEQGQRVVFGRDDSDVRWIRLGSTVEMKRLSGGEGEPQTKPPAG